jgi:uncharacterized membrane protein
MNILNFTFSTGFSTMIVRFVVCLIVNWIIIDRLYYTKSKRRDFYFTFMLTSISIFFLVFFMIFALEDLKAKTSIGIGIGLFGIFSIMRYRTDSMPVREMTYLFVIVALAVVNAIAASVSIVELLATNIIIVLAIWICESRLKVIPCKMVQYDRIELITPDRREEMIADLEKRLGLKVKYVEMGGVDFLRDMAVVKVFYEAEPKAASNTVDMKVKCNTEDMGKTEL